MRIVCASPADRHPWRGPEHDARLVGVPGSGSAPFEGHRCAMLATLMKVEVEPLFAGPWGCGRGRAAGRLVALLSSWGVVGLHMSSCVCLEVGRHTSAPAFPGAATMTVRTSDGADVGPFSACTRGFERTLGTDPCGTTWHGNRPEAGGAATSGMYPPQLSSYGYLLVFDGTRAQLCREFGDEVGDDRGCMRRDVQCATSGEVVVTAGGASFTADFSTGAHMEGAWLFPVPVDAGPPIDTWF